MVLGVFVAAPRSPMLPGPVAVGRVSHAWVGWDGSRWDLTGDREESGVRLQREARGTGLPTVEHYLSSSPALAGARWTGARALERDVFWPVLVHAGPGQDWIDHDAAWWATMRPDAVGTWEVTQPNGTTRRLRWRVVDDDGGSLDVPGEAFGSKLYVIRGLAEQPLWEGDPVVVQPLAAATPVNFYGGGPLGQAGYGPPFVVSSSITQSRAAIDNPGGHDAWVEWVVVGPCDSALLGVAGRTIEVPFPVPEGRALVVGTAPTDRWALEGDVDLNADGTPRTDEAGRLVVSGLAAPGSTGDRRRDLGSVRWEPVPPGASVPLTALTRGGGTVQPSLVPLFDRAW